MSTYKKFEKRIYGQIKKQKKKIRNCAILAGLHGMVAVGCAMYTPSYFISNGFLLGMLVVGATIGNGYYFYTGSKAIKQYNNEISELEKKITGE